MTLEGVDVSVHNGLWAGPPPDFAIVRACYGTSKDTKYDLHVARFKSLGVVTGAYAFGVYQNGTAQARAFLSFAKNAAFIALDQEAEAGKVPMTDQQAKDFIAECHRQNKKVGLYHSLSGYPALGQDWNWVAKWSPTKPAIPFSIWQYQGSPLDRDRFYGTKAQLIALGAPYLKPPPTDTTQPPAPPPPQKRPYDGMPVLPTDDIIALHEAGYWMKNGKWVKGTTTPPPPTVPPPTTPPQPKPTAPPIPTTRTPVDAVVNSYTLQPYEIRNIGNHPGVRIGTSGPVFVLVHGGPQPLGRYADLSTLGHLLSSQGAQAFCVDYDATDWRTSVSDIKAAVADVRKTVPGQKVTLVAHSFGGFPGIIVSLLEGAVDAYVSVNAITNSDSISEFTKAGAPDLVGLATLRPAMPVSVIEGSLAEYPPAEMQVPFVTALNKAGHPGYWTMGPGDHTGTLYTSATVKTILDTAKLA